MRAPLIDDMGARDGPPYFPRPPASQVRRLRDCRVFEREGSRERSPPPSTAESTRLRCRLRSSRRATISPTAPAVTLRLWLESDQYHHQRTARRIRVPRAEHPTSGRDKPPAGGRRACAPCVDHGPRLKPEFERGLARAIRSEGGVLRGAVETPLKAKRDRCRCGAGGTRALWSTRTPGA